MLIIKCWITPGSSYIDLWTSFALAEGEDRLVLGVDLSFPMLRLASEALRREQVRYPRRRVGVVYDARELDVSFPRMEAVDFWAADAIALPWHRATGALFHEALQLPV